MIQGIEEEQREGVYLSNQEVHVLLHEHIQLFLEDALHLRLTLAAQVGWSLAHSPGDQGIALVGDLTGQIAGGLVDLGALQRKDSSVVKQAEIIAISSRKAGCCSQCVISLLNSL